MGTHPIAFIFYLGILIGLGTLWLRYQNKIDFEIDDEDSEDEDLELGENEDEAEEDDSPEPDESDQWSDSDEESVIRKGRKEPLLLVKEKCTLPVRKMNLLRRKSEFLIPI